MNRNKAVINPVRQPPLQARSLETRARILECARIAFARSGFSGANLRDIAMEAGTTHAMIRYHFGTKDQLWRDAVCGMFEGLRKILGETRQQAADQGLGPRERFRHITRAYSRYCAEHPEHARITIMESISGSERFLWMVKEFVKPDHLFAKREFDELVRNKIVPPIPFVSFIYAYVGMNQFPFVLANEAKLAMDYDFLDSDAIDRHADAVFGIWTARAAQS